MHDLELALDGLAVFVDVHVEPERHLLTPRVDPAAARELLHGTPMIHPIERRRAHVRRRRRLGPLARPRDEGGRYETRGQRHVSPLAHHVRLQHLRVVVQFQSSRGAKRSPRSRRTGIWAPRNAWKFHQNVTAKPCAIVVPTSSHAYVGFWPLL